MANQKLIEGASVRLGTEDFVVPALSLGQVRRLKDDLVMVSTIHGVSLSEEQSNSVIKVLQAAISRNYPEVSAEDLEDWVDLRNLKPVLTAVLGTSGLLKDPNDPLKVAGGQ